MYICICKKITDHQIRKAVLEQRVHNIRDLRSCLRACDQCGKCVPEAKNIIRETTHERILLENHSLRAT
jgi:bacterioferritin-associated ferredoxin